MPKDKIKGFIAGVVTTSLLFSLSISAFALSGSKSLQISYDDIKLYVDQNLITPKDANGNTVEPFISNGTVYLPARAIAEALGKDVSWNSTTKSVYVGIQPAQTEYTFKGEYMGAKSYVAGKDFPAGTYNILAIGGNGTVSISNSTVDAFMGTPFKINEIKQINPALADMHTTIVYNVQIYDGIPLTINGDLTIRLVAVY